MPTPIGETPDWATRSNIYDHQSESEPHLLLRVLPERSVREGLRGEIQTRTARDLLPGRKRLGGGSPPREDHQPSGRASHRQREGGVEHHHDDKPEWRYLLLSPGSPRSVPPDHLGPILRCRPLRGLRGL